MFITIETEQEIRTRNLYGFAFNTFAQVYVRLLAICNCNSLRENPLVMLQALNCFFFQVRYARSILSFAEVEGVGIRFHSHVFPSQYSGY